MLMSDLDKDQHPALTGGHVRGESSGGNLEPGSQVARDVAGRRWLRPTTLVIGGVVSALVAAFILHSTGVLSGGDPEADGAASGPANIQFPVKPGEPCYDAKEYPINELAKMVDVPIWMPNAPAGSQKNFTGAWTCAGGNEPILIFGAVKVSYEPGYNMDVKDWCQRLIGENGGSVETILGRPGCSFPVAEEGTLPGVLVVVDSGVLIRVVADSSVPVEKLVEVANSINLEKPV